MNRSKQSSFIRILNWLGGHELAVLIGFASVVAGVLGFVVLADEVREGSMQSFDRALLLAMRRPPDYAPIGPPAFQEAVRDITSLGGVIVLGFITLVTAGFLLLDGKRRMAGLVLASAAGGLVMNLLLKNAFHRARVGLPAPSGRCFVGLWRVHSKPIERSNRLLNTRMALFDPPLKRFLRNQRTLAALMSHPTYPSRSGSIGWAKEAGNSPLREKTFICQLSVNSLDERIKRV